MFRCLLKRVGHRNQLRLAPRRANERNPDEGRFPQIARRCFVACSNANAIAISFGSLHAVPTNEIPTGIGERVEILLAVEPAFCGGTRHVLLREMRHHAVTIFLVERHDIGE